MRTCLPLWLKSLLYCGLSALLVGLAACSDSPSPASNLLPGQEAVDATAPSAPDTGLGDASWPDISGPPLADTSPAPGDATAAPDAGANPPHDSVGDTTPPVLTDTATDLGADTTANPSDSGPSEDLNSVDLPTASDAPADSLAPHDSVSPADTAGPNLDAVMDTAPSPCEPVNNCTPGVDCCSALPGANASDQWCVENCNHDPPNCPAELCQCVTPEATGCDCDDQDPCTEDIEASGGCSHLPLTGPACDDGDPCTSGDSCVAGTCAADEIQSCDDQDACTYDQCSPNGECLNPPIDCEDGDPCTDDSCNGTSGLCQHLPQEGSCSDGDPCTTGDTCTPQGCVGELLTPCDAPTPKRLGYYTNWAQYRTAPRAFTPNDIDPFLHTHIIYGFADIQHDGPPGLAATGFRLTPLEWNDVKEETIGVDWTEPQGHYFDVIGLKAINPELKVLISVGGWTFNDPYLGPGSGLYQSHGGVSPAWIFSTIIANPAERTGFIGQILDFCASYGFDGIDLDWEYPGFADRNCVPGLDTCETGPDGAFLDRVEDYDNYVTFLAELRAAANADTRFDAFLIGLAVAAGQERTIYYNFPGIAPYVDWIGLMTYDLHGAWDAVTGSQTPLMADSSPGGHYYIDYVTKLYACPPSDTPSGDDALNAWCAEPGGPPNGGFGVPRSKLLLGLAGYGRGWSGVSQPGLGQPASGPCPAGPYTQSPGMLAWYEIQDLMADPTWEYHWDDGTSTPYLYSAPDQVLITYDDPTSLGLKLAYLQEQGLGGSLFWAMDLDAFTPSDIPQNPLQTLIKDALSE